VRAIIREAYGTPDVLQLRDIERPGLGASDVLVRVHACSINASDWEFLTGSPAYIRAWGLFTPRVSILGSDIAGRVVAVGKNVTRLRVGDAVFGDALSRWGGFAEYASIPDSLLRPKPSSLSFEQAAAMPQSALVALQGLGGAIGPGQKVLINGAGGGSGTFAIQIAKALGAEVTGVDSGAKLVPMRALGADHVIDYAQTDFTTTGERYDLILDLVARRPLLQHRRALTPSGTYRLAGGHLGLILQAATLGPLLSSLGRQKLGLLAVKQNEGLERVVELFEAGKLVPVIERVFPLERVPEALRHVGEGRAQGKVVIALGAEENAE
jgi:NADPH:quinone reductase-like Zn-dependent oxidoreductase